MLAVTGVYSMAKKIGNNNKQTGSSKPGNGASNSTVSMPKSNSRRQKGNRDKKKNRANCSKHLNRRKTSHASHKFDDDLRKAIEAGRN
jgi:hypothetical protein